MTNPGGRAVSTMEPVDRHKSGRLFEGPWSIDSASESEPRQVRNYARHARSIPARRRRQRVLAIAVAGAVAATIAVAVPRAIGIFTRRPHVSLGIAAAARNRAAAWIVRWVSSSAVVACDPLMCSVLQAHGLPSERLTVLTSSSLDPVGSDVVVETALTRGMFGENRAAVYAPAVLASFGHGKAAIKIRVTSKVGSTKQYERLLSANEQLRRQAGYALLGNSQIAESEAAEGQLANGQVDARILATLPLLAQTCPLTILRFGHAAPGSSPGMPLLSIDVAATDSTGNNALSARNARIVARGPLVGIEGPRALVRMMAVLDAQRQPLRAARFSERTTRTGKAFLHVVYTAPTPIPLPGSDALMK
jgi:hypothetical protein